MWDCTPSAIDKEIRERKAEEQTEMVLCPLCGGSGSFQQEICVACKGEGEVQKELYDARFVA